MRKHPPGQTNHPEKLDEFPQNMGTGLEAETHAVAMEACRIARGRILVEFAQNLRNTDGIPRDLDVAVLGPRESSLLAAIADGSERFKAVAWCRATLTRELVKRFLQVPYFVCAPTEARYGPEGVVDEYGQPNAVYVRLYCSVAPFGMAPPTMP